MQGKTLPVSLDILLFNYLYLLTVLYISDYNYGIIKHRIMKDLRKYLKCKVQSAKCKVQSAKCKVQSAKCKGDMFSLKYRTYLIPLVSFGFVCLIFCVMLIFGVEVKTFAGAVPSRSEIYLQTHLQTNQVDIAFSGSDAQQSKKDTGYVNYAVKTNNPTEYMNYLSSIDEDVNLNHTDPTVTDKIRPFSPATLYNNIPENTWGYCDQDLDNCKPIAPASHPSVIYSPPDVSSSLISTRAKYGYDITDIYYFYFVARVSPNLTPGTYSKKVLFTTITKEFTPSATFLPGKQFNDIVANLDSTHTVNVFKRSNIPPANLASASVVSTADSGRPIYAWFNAPDRTVYWWTDADVAYVNNNANQMFEDFNRGVADMDLIDIRGMDTRYTKTMHNFFCDGNKSVKNYNIDGINTSGVWDFSGMFAGGDQLATAKNPVDFSKINTSSAIDMSNMFQRSNFTTIDVRSFDTKNVKYMGCMFCGVIKAKNIDLRGWDVSNLLGSHLMFASTQIEHINLAGWNSHQLLDTSRMFEGTVTLQSLDMTGMDTSKVKNMFGMFYLSALPDLDLTQLNTSSVTNMNSMFKQMSRISSLNFASFDTSNVTDFGEMFRGIVIGSRTLDVRSFNTSKATAMWMMFDGTNLIGNLDLSNFDTSHVGDMSNMFSNSVFLNSVNVSSFNTSAVVNMQGMFYRTLGMPVINIANFNTTSVQNMQDMFRETGAVIIKASALFNTNSVIDSSRMFMDAVHLVGGSGTPYNASFPQDKTYARQDVAGLPGYFTF